MISEEELIKEEIRREAEYDSISEYLENKSGLRKRSAD